MTKRLLFISPMFPKNQEEDIIVPFITHFTEKFAATTTIKVDVIALMFPQTGPYQFGNVTVYPVGSGYRKSYRIVPYLLKAIFKGIRLHRKHQYDGVLCFWYRECALIGSALGHLLKIRQMVWMLGQDVRKDNKYIKWLQLPGKKLIVVSSYQNDILFENHDIRPAKIANVAIDRDRFPEFNDGKRSIDVLGVGNLSALKNYGLFLEIIQLLKADFPNIQAVICGEGEEKEMLLEKVKRFRLEDNVRLTGTVSHKEVLGHMNNSKIFLHTSTFEGNSTAIQEALYSGCNIASMIPLESSESIDTFFYGMEKDALAEKIKSILKNPSVAKRIEKFKMEDTVKVVFDAFYSNDKKI